MLEAMLLLGGYVISRWVGRDKSLLISLVVILMVLLNYSTVNTLINGGLAIVSFTLVICGIHFLLKKQDEAAGLMLALSLVKPDMVYPILLILIVWVIVTRRLTVFWWFLATFVLVMGFSMVLIPNWPVDYLRSVIEYSARNPVRMTALAPTALEIRFLLVKNLAIALLIIYEWFVVKTRGSQRFLWTSGLLLAVSPWIGGTTSPAHTILIIPALFIGIGYLGGSRKEKSSLRMLLIPLLLGLSSWLFSGWLVSGISEAWQNNWLKVVVPLVVLVILYWSRWWVIRSEKFSQAHFTLS